MIDDYEDRYVQQIHRLNAVIQQNQSDQQYDVVFEHNDARPHISNKAKAADQNTQLGSSLSNSVILQQICEVFQCWLEIKNLLAGDFLSSKLTDFYPHYLQKFYLTLERSIK